ncbi:hypothetical protein [Chitinophaga solisilvae]|uniref:hypothetical protein n=1 Tax=Chitinophaga solisilvae TaxID=1233460 RepID=UPI00136C474B|nr:hypothetical protein [Chitinophaga solisilvae]
MKKGFITAIGCVMAGAVSFGILGTFVKLARGDGYDVPAITFAQVFTGLVFLLLLNALPPGRREATRYFTGREKLLVILHGGCVGLISTEPCTWASVVY